MREFCTWPFTCSGESAELHFYCKCTCRVLFVRSCLFSAAMSARKSGEIVHNDLVPIPSFSIRSSLKRMTCLTVENYKFWSFAKNPTNNERKEKNRSRTISSLNSQKLIGNLSAEFAVLHFVTISSSYIPLRCIRYSFLIASLFV